MTRPFDELPAMVEKLGDRLGRDNTERMFQLSLIVKDEFLSGPPRVGVSRHGRLKWGAGFDKVTGYHRHGRDAVLVKYRGPVHWIERGTGPHVITPKGAVGSRASRAARVAAGQSLRFRGRQFDSKHFGRRRGAGGLAFPDGRVRTFVRHPGSRAQPFFDGVVTRSRKASRVLFAKDLKQSITDAGFGRG